MWKEVNKSFWTKATVVAGFTIRKKKLMELPFKTLRVKQKKNNKLMQAEVAVSMFFISNIVGIHSILHGF